MTAAEIPLTPRDDVGRRRHPHTCWAPSFASAYHGTPRATPDIDLVIDPTRGSLDVFVALRERRRFSVVDARSGWKADLFVRKDRPFGTEELRRHAPATVLGVKLFVASAEDTLLAKLEWTARTDP